MSLQSEKISTQLHCNLSYLLAKTDTTMTSDEALYIYTLAIKTHESGALINLRIRKSGSIYCLAKAAKTWDGKVVAINPHKKVERPPSVQFDDNDSKLFLRNLEKFGLADYIDYRRDSSHSISANWSDDIDFIFIDGNHRKEVVKEDIADWKKFVRDGGAIAFHDANNGSEVDQAIDETLYNDPAFIPIQGMGRIRAFKKHGQNPEMILCSGLQSGGTTLISWCFLQRPDMNGILDMWSEGILLMPYVSTRLSWCKMTTSCFRWQEVADFYSDQGWHVRPLLVVRDVRSAYSSLRKKPYGLNGTTAEDPPLRIRFKRFLNDWEEFKANDWPIVKFESLISDPEDTLQKCCSQLELPYYDDMMLWPKNHDEVYGFEESNETFLGSLSGKTLEDSLINTKSAVQTRGIAKEDLIWLEETFHAYNKENGYPLHVPLDQPSDAIDRPAFFVTQRRKNNGLQKELAIYNERFQRITNSIFWKVLFPARYIYHFFSTKTKHIHQ